MPSRSTPYTALFLGLLFVSSAGPFLVMARMDAWAVVFYRLLFAGLGLLAWSAARGELRLPHGHGGRLVVGALLLAAHIGLWAKAFDLTDYASNLLLLVSQPVLAAVIGGWLGEKQGRETWISIALALGGLAIIARGDFALGPRALLGDLLCIVASLAISLFIPLTRRARAELPLATFLGITFLLGAAAMLPVALLSGARLASYPTESWLWLAALVLVPTMAGHGLMNLAARSVRLFTLNLVIVLEPAIAIAMGAVLFGAGVTPLQLGGGVLLAAAVAVGLRQEAMAAPQPA